MTGVRGPIRAVFFDLGNTLIHFTGSWAEVLPASNRALGAALLESGLHLDLPAFLAEFSRRMEAYFARREDECLEFTTESVLRRLLADLEYADVPATVLQAALARMYAISQAHWQPEQDALPTLRKLAGAGYRIGLISNASDAADAPLLDARAAAEALLTSAGLESARPRPVPRAQSVSAASDAASSAESGSSTEKYGADKYTQLVLFPVNVQVRSFPAVVTS